MESNALNIYAIARYQKYILYCFLATLVLNALFVWSTAALPEELDPESARQTLTALANLIVLVFIIAVLVATMIFVYQLARTMNSPYALLWALALIIGLFVPFLNLIILLVLVLKASWIIKEAGYRVGILGADLNEIPQPEPSPGET